MLFISLIGSFFNMIEAENNIILIGMPGVGKSTVGVLLAKRLNFCYLDTDIYIKGT
jgi:shikimate kinase